MPQLVDRTLCLLYRVLPAAHSQEERQTADAFALWAGEWIDLMHHMGVVVEIPADVQFAAASVKAGGTGKRRILKGPDACPCGGPWRWLLQIAGLGEFRPQSPCGA